jgi:uncharacterized membrane-anchored protein YitT (DUF2179 family)
VNKKNIFKYFKYFALIILGNILYSFGVKAIIEPNQLVTGGVTGLSLFLARTYNIDSTLLVAIFTLVIFIAGFLILGKELAAQTLASSIIYPICLWFFGLFDLSFVEINDPWLQVIVAGVIIGVGLGLIMRANASTGGMDTIGLIIHKYCKIASIGVYLLVLDTIVMFTQAPSAGIDKFIFGIILALIYSIMIDKVMLAGKSKVELLIISNKQEEVRNLIINEYDRTLTYLHSKTGYLNHEIDTILTVVDIRELNKIKEQIYALDAGAFIVVNKVSEVSGRGFTTIKKYK